VRRSPCWLFSQRTCNAVLFRVRGISPVKLLLESFKNDSEFIFPRNSGNGPARLQPIQERLVNCVDPWSVCGKCQPPELALRLLLSNASTSKLWSPSKKSEGMESKLLLSRYKYLRFDRPRKEGNGPLSLLFWRPTLKRFVSWLRFGARGPLRFSPFA